MSIKISPPVIEWVDMTHWHLKDMESTFIIPDFERRPSEPHIIDIMNAIRDHKFFDTVIRGYKNKAGKVVLVDFQHRREAFSRLYRGGELIYYDFMLALYQEKDAILVYRSLNIGKALTGYDHYKALAKDHPFTKKLEKYCYFYRGAKKLAFLDLLLAVNYAITKSLKADTTKQTQYLANLKPSDIEFAMGFIKVYSDLQPEVVGNPLYRSTIFRSLCRIMYENKIDAKQLKRIQDYVLKSDTFKDIYDKTTGHKDSKEYFGNLIGEINKKKIPGGELRNET